MVSRGIGYALCALWALLLCAGCKPKLEGRPSLVDGDRVLAVRSVPAETKAGASVQYEALYVGLDGPVDPAGLDWALCNERKPLAVTGPIAIGCLTKSADSLTPIEGGAQPKGKLPADVCRVFGPNPPAPKMGEPATRPADPDTTGGYYQPVRVLARIEGHDQYAVGVTRLNCNLANATQEQSSEYQSQHQPNENPALDSLVLRGKPDQTVPGDGDGDPLAVSAGKALTLRASWIACPATAECGDGICSPGEDKSCDDCSGSSPRGCTGSEPYLELDPIKHALVHRREAIRVSWFATDGDFDHDRTGRAESEAKTSFSDNTWTAPKHKGEVRLWVVIRDDRGGVGWSAYRLDVQ